MKERFQGMVQTVWSDAGRFMDSYYGRTTEKEANNPVSCFRELLSEIRKLSALKQAL
jgi:hypothetical protein